MSEGTRTSDDPSAVPSSGDLESATPTAQRASSLALVVALGVLVVIAIAGVWWYVTSAGAAAEEEAAARMKELGAFVRADRDGRVRTVNVSLAPAHANIDALVRELPALNYLENLNALNAPLTDEHLRTVGELGSLLALDLTGTDVTSEGMAHLTGLDNLLTLVLYGTKVDDTGLEHVGRINSLKILNIGNTRVTGDLSGLLPLSNLEWLLAGGMEISDEAVGTMAQLPKLSHLSILEATVSQQALAKLREKKPGIQIDE